MKNTLRRRTFVSAIAMLIVSAIVLTSSTFAWFSIAQDATVGDLSMSISGGTELLVSLDGTNYSDNISKEQLEEHFKKTLHLTNVTTLDLESYFSSYDNASVAVANEDYISFDLWFKTNDFMCIGLYLTNNITPNYNYDVALNNKLRGTYCFSKGVSYTAPIDFQYSATELRQKNSTDTYYGADAMRIGIKELNIDLAPLKTEP